MHQVYTTTSIHFWNGKTFCRIRTFPSLPASFLCCVCLSKKIPTTWFQYILIFLQDKVNFVFSSYIFIMLDKIIRPSKANLFYLFCLMHTEVHMLSLIISPFSLKILKERGSHSIQMSGRRTQALEFIYPYVSLILHYFLEYPADTLQLD